MFLKKFGTHEGSLKQSIITIESVEGKIITIEYIVMQHKIHDKKLESRNQQFIDKIDLRKQ
jgi:hypothetical protein